MQPGGDLRHHPHIILITAEAIEASHTSVYGYGRDTTPFLNRLAGGSLVADNAFNNSAHTTGAIATIFTSKYPTQTRVLYPPDILRSIDSYQHLPGILQLADYYNIQYSISHYADAQQMNIKRGFAESNGCKLKSGVITPLISRHIEGDPGYFIHQLVIRAANRLGHIFHIKTMKNVFSQVTQTPKSCDDATKFSRVLDTLTAARQPVFAHIHYMATHGPKFLLKQQAFSKNIDLDKQQPWNDDIYDDSILEFDSLLKDFWNELNLRGLQEDVILVIASDHGKKWTVNQRIFFLIRFPHQDHAGRILENVQHLDIAPTLLDYLNIDIPPWMEGRSLIADDLTNVPILSAGTDKKEQVPGRQWIVREQYRRPPFYHFSYINVVDRHKWWRLNLDDMKWTCGKIANHTDPVSADLLMPFAEVAQLVIQHLLNANFQVLEATAARIAQYQECE